jgi:hypothetical protein
MMAMSQAERVAKIKERMGNQQTDQPGIQPVGQPPMPAPSAASPEPNLPVPPSAPVQDGQPPAPAPAAPAEPAAPPAPDLDEVREEYERQMRERDAEVQRLREEAEQRDQEMRNLLAAAQEKTKLPSAAELDGMSQGEAILKTAEAMMAATGLQLQDLTRDLNRNVVAPTLKKVDEVALAEKRRVAAEAYSQEAVNKHRKAFDEMAKKYPEMLPSQVLKAVANPRDLSSAQAPTTPAAPGQPAGAHIPSGVSARASAAQQPQPSPNQVSVRQHLERSQELRERGDKWGADQARREAIKTRLRNRNHPGM